MTSVSAVLGMVAGVRPVLCLLLHKAAQGLETVQGSSSYLRSLLVYSSSGK